MPRKAEKKKAEVEEKQKVTFSRSSSPTQWTDGNLAILLYTAWLNMPKEQVISILVSRNLSPSYGNTLRLVFQSCLKKEKMPRYLKSYPNLYDFTEKFHPITNDKLLKSLVKKAMGSLPTIATIC